MNQIQVSDGTIATQAATAGRYILTAGGAFALGKGWVDDQTLQFVTGLVTVVVPLAYGVWKAYHNKSLLIVTAEAAPNSVAVVK